MDHNTVRRLEEQLQEAVADVIRRSAPRDLPLQPSPRTMHLMAKAAVAVYESAVENWAAGGGDV